MATVSNFPTKPRRQAISSDSFPTDLPSDFCTTMSFSGGSAAMIGSVVRLPLPKRINDLQNIIWEEHSLTQMALGLMPGASTAVNLWSAATDKALNPFMFMTFKRPQFKEHTLAWTLSPDSQQESDKLKNIINTLKKASLPSGTGSKFIMKYPALVKVTLNPKQYLFPFKECAIQSVQIDYTGGGLSFFDSKAPTIVNLTLHLKETKLWQADDMELL